MDRSARHCAARRCAASRCAASRCAASHCAASHAATSHGATSHSAARRTPASPAPARRPRPVLRQGFTIIELLGVILVLGLIATLITVNWRAVLPRTELHSAVRELASTLASTRSDAIARNALFELQYDLEQHRYRVVTPFRAATEQALGGLATVEEERLALDWQALPASVRFDSIAVGTEVYVKGLVVVFFDALGSASGHVIVLRQPEYDNRYTIEVQGLLGLIAYHEGLYEREPPKEADFQ